MRIYDTQDGEVLDETPNASRESVPQIPMKLSVQPTWCLALPLQQQSVLLLGARGPDGIAKAHPCKDVQRAYRGTVLIAAKYGRCLVWGEKADTFMSLESIADDQLWEATVNCFFNHSDDLPHHFMMHLMHGAEIIAYKHPDERYRRPWGWFYERCVTDLHLTKETEDEMDARLSDWERKHWETPSVPSPTEALTASGVSDSPDELQDADADSSWSFIPNESPSPPPLVSVEEWTGKLRELLNVAVQMGEVDLSQGDIKYLCHLLPAEINASLASLTAEIERLKQAFGKKES